jgi:hypothetical protein
MPTPLIDLSILERDFAQLERQGVSYGLGAKAPAGFFHAAPDVSLANLKHIDCSGYVRLAIYRATGGKLTLPDGSQNQRAWAEKNLREVPYQDAARYMTGKRLFICFIKPHANGCGDVGHVWLLLDGSDNDGRAETFESHGGAGIDSRAWNTRVLLREVYSCFEVPTLQSKPPDASH